MVWSPLPRRPSPSSILLYVRSASPLTIVPVRFSQVFAQKLSESTLPVPDILNQTFLAVDSELSKLAQEEKTHSGCTAVVAYLKVDEPEPTTAEPEVQPTEPVHAEEEEEEVEKGKMARVKGVFGKFAGGSSGGSGLFGSKKNGEAAGAAGGSVVRKSLAKRTLYTANVGDARAVISLVPSF